MTTLDRARFEHLYLNANCIAEIALLRALDKAASAPAASTPEQRAAAEAFAHDLHHPDPATFDWSALEGLYGFDGPLDASPPATTTASATATTSASVTAPATGNGKGHGNGDGDSNGNGIGDGNASAGASASAATDAEPDAETAARAPARVPSFDEMVGIDDDDDLDAPIDIGRYLARVDEARPSLQPRVDDCFARADLAALEAALATLPAGGPPLTSALAPDEFTRWLELYESHHEGLEAAVLAIRRLEPLL